MKLPARKKPLSLRGALFLCALSGALLALCFPRPGWWFLAWVALAPWLVALRMGSTPPRVMGGVISLIAVLVVELGPFGWVSRAAEDGR